MPPLNQLYGNKIDIGKLQDLMQDFLHSFSYYPAHVLHSNVKMTIIKNILIKRLMV